MPIVAACFFFEFFSCSNGNPYIVGVPQTAPQRNNLGKHQAPKSVCNDDKKDYWIYAIIQCKDPFNPIHTGTRLMYTYACIYVRDTSGVHKYMGTWHNILTLCGLASAHQLICDSDVATHNTH